ncbi:hypothetical protein U0035_15165 [Niabella yanshanensis]|uniref:DUF4134 domain-containing protein n=1 Tax=Niabella yanshanensis TaxID=577386 RepID=A0ABZ0W1F2_9BACT|nr:hypothetical protein [Niabella yanshanensis]WQD37011.1 hypothetical protein U0035_15165 [Niabella yanshanensis]
MKTKQLLTATIASLCLYTAQAQTSNSAGHTAFQRDFAKLAIEHPNKSIFVNNAENNFNYNEEKYRKFKKLRTGGIILTSVGAGLIIGGTALIIDGNNQNDGYNFSGNYYDGDLTDGDGKIVAGAVGIAFGALSVGGGITMWVIGNNKMKKYGGGQMSIQPTKNGLGLAYKF